MKARFIKTYDETIVSSIKIQHGFVKHIFDVRYYHDELELNLILNGEGTRFIGNNIERFIGPDLVLIGSNLPHVWKNDEIYYNADMDNKVEIIKWI